MSLQPKGHSAIYVLYKVGQIVNSFKLSSFGCHFSLSSHCILVLAFVVLCEFRSDRHPVLTQLLFTHCPHEWLIVSCEKKRWWNDQDCTYHIIGFEKRGLEDLQSQKSTVIQNLGLPDINPFTPKNDLFQNFPCSLTRNITPHSMKNLVFTAYSDER